MNHFFKIFCPLSPTSVRPLVYKVFIMFIWRVQKGHTSHCVFLPLKSTYSWDCYTTSKYLLLLLTNRFHEYYYNYLFVFVVGLSVFIIICIAVGVGVVILLTGLICIKRWVHRQNLINVLTFLLDVYRLLRELYLTEQNANAPVTLPSGHRSI